MDEPATNLHPKGQQELRAFIKDFAIAHDVLFIIATHSPFILSIEGAKIYNLDEKPVTINKWWELENAKVYFNFFDKHRSLFEQGKR